MAITLSLTLFLSVLTGVANSWRSAIDGIFGTASTIIETGYKYYESRYYDCIVGQGNASSGKGASSWVYDDEVSYTFGYIYGSNLELGNQQAFDAGGKAIALIVVFVITWIVSLVASFLEVGKKQ